MSPENTGSLPYPVKLLPRPGTPYREWRILSYWSAMAPRPGAEMDAVMGAGGGGVPVGCQEQDVGGVLGNCQDEV